MELIDRSEIIDSYAVRRLVKRGEPISIASVRLLKAPHRRESRHLRPLTQRLRFTSLPTSSGLEKR
jgi:hypothetical protein